MAVRMNFMIDGSSRTTGLWRPRFLAPPVLQTGPARLGSTDGGRDDQDRAVSEAGSGRRSRSLAGHALAKRLAMTTMAPTLISSP